MSLASQLADAVVSKLSSAGFNQTFSVQRVAVPETDLDKLSGIKVSVVTTGVKIKQVTRAVSEYTFTVEIGVQKKVSDELAEVAAMGAFVEDIAAFLRVNPLTSMPGAQWRETAIAPVYSEEHLTKMRVFTSVIQVTYSLTVQH